jgi:hypothetical protein
MPFAGRVSSCIATRSAAAAFEQEAANSVVVAESDRSVECNGRVSMTLQLLQ